MNQDSASQPYRDMERLFARDPQNVVTRLISEKALKGNRLSVLRRILLEDTSNAEMAEWLWLVLSPRILSVMITQDRCNLACRMCGGSKGTLKYLKPAHFCQILRHIPTADLVTLVAGNSEPLLNPAMPEILRCAKDERVNLDIVTNGQLLSPHLIQTMMETGRPTGLNISIDAAKSETYRRIRGAPLDKLFRNLEYLSERKRASASEFPKVSLLMVGMEDNIEELPDLVLLASRMKAYRVHVDHLKGHFSPGDFVKNPRWRLFVSEAYETAATCNVFLQMPLDVVVSPSSQDAASNHNASPMPIQKLTGAPPRLNYCSWMESAQIDRTGNLSPCCHNPRVLGNIFEKHISQQIDYLRYRMKNMDGKVEKCCLGAKNCAYVEEKRAFGTVPGLFV
jgi:MoaA/NifB/PqqE/SkfB family radical SAM enzyme